MFYSPMKGGLKNKVIVKLIDKDPDQKFMIEKNL